MTMPRYIDADALLKTAYDCIPVGIVGRQERLLCAEGLINNAPTISPDEVRGVGEWIKYAPHNSDMMVCSACEKYWILDGDQYDYRYCPRCGAKMEVTSDA